MTYQIIGSKKSRKFRKGKKCNLKKRKVSKKRGGMIRALTNMYRAYRYPDTVPDKEYPNGDIYIGALENDLPNGQGKMTYANRDIYEGNWENGQRSGHGIMKNAVFKQEYEGDWVNGELHQGIIRWLHNNYFQNNMRYEGDLIQNMELFQINGNVMFSAEGQGTMEYANGDRYVGNWVNTQKNGYGTETYANGDVYKGNFFNDEKSGSGTMRYADGSSWAGIWAHGNKDPSRPQAVKRGK